MNIRITGRHLDVTDALRECVSEKVARLTRFFDGVIDVDVTLALDGDQCMAEVRVPAVRGQTIVAQATGSEMYQAIDLVIDKTERQLTRLKEKLRDHRTHHQQAPPPPDVLESEEDYQEEEEQQ